MAAVATDSGNSLDVSEADARRQLQAMVTHDEPLEATLRTDKRVLARVTDGIYRQPGSALRELVSNAYDADATRVVLRTDRPRFQRIVIDDDGAGMSSDALLHMLYHIGGSAKRTSEGPQLGITDPNDRHLSPGGRPLIGKIGIGLFSVAQLTQSFQVVTKVADQQYRTIASVVLRQFADEADSGDSEEGQYEAGKVLVWKEPAPDPATHGTSIILTAMRPQTQETLRSWDRWQGVFPQGGRSDTPPGLAPPKYHIGVVANWDGNLLREQPAATGRPEYARLPWDASDSPEAAFDKLAAAIWDAQFRGDPNPRVSKLCDYYLNMVWALSLEAPLPYMRRHPLQTRGGDDVSTYRLADNLASVTELRLAQRQSVGELLGFGQAAEQDGQFQVIVDDLSLRRPIDVTEQPSTTGALKRPMLFVGQHREEFVGHARELSGGPLGFLAYFLWAPRIVPAEHQGVLIRVHNASGTRFDETFLHYPVAEQRRLTQISCEVFITQGFDGALNIDRESFNFSHPHVVAVTRWVHTALRLVIAEQKRLGSQVRRTRRTADAETLLSDADELVREVWDRRASTDAAPPRVAFLPGLKNLGSDSFRNEGDEPGYFFDDSVLGTVASGPERARRRRQAEARLTSIVQTLDAFDLLEPLTEKERHDLVSVLQRLIDTFR